jgi:hypothetical protein
MCYDERSESHNRAKRGSLLQGLDSNPAVGQMKKLVELKYQLRISEVDKELSIKVDTQFSTFIHIQTYKLQTVSDNVLKIASCKERQFLESLLRTKYFTH